MQWGSGKPLLLAYYKTISVPKAGLITKHHVENDFTQHLACSLCRKHYTFQRNAFSATTGKNMQLEICKPYQFTNYRSSVMLVIGESQNIKEALAMIEKNVLDVGTDEVPGELLLKIKKELEVLTTQEARLILNLLGPLLSAQHPK